MDSRTDSAREASPQLYDFAAAVGVRRAEYARLRGSDLIYDESDYLYVQIRWGKGGKYQEQRVLPGDEVFVRSYFNGTESYVFSRKEVEKKSDLHHLRDVLARRLGRPTEYDRLAVMATNVFHLNHWRCDVTVSNYLPAY